MDVPASDVFCLPLLQALADGKEHSIRELRDLLARKLMLASANRADELPPSTFRLFLRRVGWAKTYLQKAGLIATSRRSWCVITPEGREVIANPPELITRRFLLQYDSFRSFTQGNQSKQDQLQEQLEAEEAAPIIPRESRPQARTQLR